MGERNVHDQTKRPSGFDLTAVGGFSDQAHFADVAWYRREVIQAIKPDQQLTCMEHVLHTPWKEASDFKGTFLYGGPEAGPFVLDLIYGAQAHDTEGRLTKLPPAPSRQIPS